MQNPEELFQIYKKNPKEESLVKLLQSLQPIIYAVCFKVVKNEADCHDVSQNVLLTLIRDIHQLQNVNTIIGWVHQISFYTALKFRREQIKQRALGKKSIEEQMESSDDSTLVIHEHIQKLDKESQQLILLKFFDNKTFEEIYQVTGKAYSSAHFEIKKILLTLKNSLEKAGYFSIATSLEKVLETSIQIPKISSSLSPLVKNEIKKIAFKKVMIGPLAKILTASAIAIFVASAVLLNVKPDSDVALKEFSAKQSVGLQAKKDLPQESKVLNRPIKINDKAPIDKTTFIAEESIDFIPEDKKEKELISNISEKNKAETKPSLIQRVCFVDKNENSFFEGRQIPVQEGEVEIQNGVKVSFAKKSNGTWLVRLLTEKYFLERLQKNISYDKIGAYIKLDKAEELSNIKINSAALIKIEFQSQENYDLSDNMHCYLMGAQFKSETISTLMRSHSRVNKNSAIFYVDFIGNVSLENIIVGPYIGKFNKIIELKYGERINLTVNIEKAQEQTFLITDSENNPLQDYFVVFTQDTFGTEISGINMEDCLKNYANTENLPIGDYIGKTDKNGNTKTIRFPFEIKEIFDFVNYDCYVFGKFHSPQRFIINAKNLNKTIELKLSKNTQVIINAFLNNKPYQGEFSFKWLNDPKMFHPAVKSFQKLSPVEIMSGKLSSPEVMNNGRVEILDLPPRKHKFKLSIKGFSHEEFTVDLSESNKAEVNIHLTPAEHFVHGYVKNTDGKPISNIDLSFYYDSGPSKITTDEKGYFKFTGMEVDKKCEIQGVDGDFTLETDLSKGYLPSNNELLIIVSEKKAIPLTVIGLDGKKLLNFKYVLNIFVQGRGFPNYMLGGKAENGELKDKIEEYGIYHFEIEVPDAPKIIFDWDILKAEDVVEKIVYAELGFDVMGLVKDVNGNSIENILITQANEVFSPFSKFNSIGVTTNKEGFFKIKECLRGKLYWILKVGYSPFLLEIKDENKKEAVEIVLQKTVAVKGQILNSINKPHAKVKIYGSLNYNQKCTYSVSSETNQDGTFVLEGLALGEWTFTFYLEGLRGVYDQKIKIKAENEELKITHDFKLDEK